MPTLSSKRVINFLKKHPTFIIEHSEELADLDLDINVDGNIFLEKQLEALKERQEKQQQKLDFVVDSALSNQKLEDQLLEFTMTVLRGGQAATDPIEFVKSLLIQHFDINDVLLLSDLSTDSTDMTDRYEEVSQRIMHHSSICDDRVATSLLEDMFPNSAGEIKSSAFIPLLLDDSITGVLVLGSNDQERFHPDMGVLFLDRLGRLIGNYLGGRE